MNRKDFKMLDPIREAEMLARLGKIARALSKLAAFHASRLNRRDPALWVFGEPRTFDGNAHYLFLSVAHREADIEAIWITADRSIAERIKQAGLKAEVSGTPPAKRILRRAGVYIYNNRVSEIGARWSNGAVLVNLWHGSGLKRIAAHNKNNILSKLRGNRLRHRLRASYVAIEQANSAVFVSTSPAIATRFSEAYDAPLADCPIIGTPRLDATADQQMRAWSRGFGTYAEFERARKKYREIYVYMPTFREGQREFLREALPDPDKLSALLQTRSAVLFVKIHPQDKTGQAMLDGGFARSTGRILPWPRGVMVYNVIDEIDCLITDYSSVMFDFIAVKSSGLVLYPFDIDRYVDERGFYFPYEQSVAGLRANSFSELCDAIATGRAVAEIEPGQLARARSRCWAGSKRPASRHVTDEIRCRSGLRSKT